VAVNNGVGLYTEASARLRIGQSTIAGNGFSWRVFTGAVVQSLATTSSPATRMAIPLHPPSLK
jgi:hypothetical protein